MNLDEKVKNFWEDKGATDADGTPVTHRDKDQIILEMGLIRSLLSDDDVLLDVGCGNGFASSVYAEKCRKVTGIDFAGHMIEAAQKHQRKENLEFQQFDVLALDDRLGKFSVIVSTRCLINILSWEKQQEAIRRIHACLKRNGRFIMAEGSQQGRKSLNDMRLAVGLEAMPPVWHNLDFDEETLLTFMGGLFKAERDIRFGLYDVMTRVYYPSSILPEQPRYGTPFHASARQLQESLTQDPLPQFSREFIMVFRKK